MQCPQGEVFFQFLENTLSPDQQNNFLNHVMHCQVCSQKLIFMNQVQRYFNKIHGNETNIEDCCSPDLLSAFVDGYLTPDKNEKVISHLLECEACLQQLLALKDILREKDLNSLSVPQNVWTKVNRFGQPDRNIVSKLLAPKNIWQGIQDFFSSFHPVITEVRWPYWISMGTAIVILLLVAYFPFTSPIDERFTIQVISPQMEIYTDCPVFKWKGAKGIRQYYIEVRCESLTEIVWQAQTKKTSIQYPIDAVPKLKCNQHYRWYVRGERNAGEIVSSDSGHFYIADMTILQDD